MLVFSVTGARHTGGLSRLAFGFVFADSQTWPCEIARSIEGTVLLASCLTR